MGGVRFTPDCLGGYCSSGNKVLRIFVNGKPVAGDPRLVTLLKLTDRVWRW